MYHTYYKDVANDDPVWHLYDDFEGDRYAVRYRECNILEAACVRRRLDRIEKLLEG